MVYRGDFFLIQKKQEFSLSHKIQEFKDFLIRDKENRNSENRKFSGTSKDDTFEVFQLPPKKIARGNEESRTDITRVRLPAWACDIYVTAQKLLKRPFSFTFV